MRFSHVQMDVPRKEGPVLLTECEVEVSFLINVAMFSVHALAFALVLVMASRLIITSCFMLLMMQLCSASLAYNIRPYSSRYLHSVYQ